MGEAVSNVTELAYTYAKLKVRTTSRIQIYYKVNSIVFTKYLS